MLMQMKQRLHEVMNCWWPQFSLQNEESLGALLHNRAAAPVIKIHPNHSVPEKYEKYGTLYFNILMSLCSVPCL